jgi:hypothetical protein
MHMAGLAWLRRLFVSFGIGTTSYIIMLGIMVLAVVYDKELEPVVTFAFNTGRSIVDAFDKLVSGSSWGQVAVNHLRERVNMTHVVLSLPAIIIATLLVGIPLNKVLGGTRTALQRMAIALISIPSTVVPPSPRVQLQRDVPGHLCVTVALCRLGLAGIAQCPERLRRYHPRRAQTDECCQAGLFRAPLRHHGSVQHGGVVPGQRAVHSVYAAQRLASVQRWRSIGLTGRAPTSCSPRAHRKP